MNKYLVAIGTLLLTACGGSDSSNHHPTTLATKIIGTVSNVSANHQQITINGQRINIANADIRYQQQPIRSEAIQVGMRLELISKDQQAQAITFDPALVGAISAIDRVKNNITVNGILLNVKSASQYQIGQWVAVNGYPTDSGTWQVESINMIDFADQAEIEGRVSALDNNQFQIDTLTINYQNAQLEGNLIEGAWVEVEGQLSQDGRLFTAYQVEVDGTNDSSLFDDLEIAGTVTWINDEKTRFELNSHTRLYVNARTEFDDGQASDLQLGRSVEVEVKAQSDGLWAKEIEFEDSSNSNIPNLTQSFELEGMAELITDNTGSSQLQINGFSFVIDARTEFEAGLSLATINQRWIKIEGIQLADGQWLAKEVDVEQQDHDVELAGQVTNNQLWGYTASDESLTAFNGQWISVECGFIGNDIFNCRKDD
ncbi:hypothetical protein G7083_00910 [Vibrio sp. HDW18]|uniref:DUF5666 domain-containing protein n=1 Tax=Vibrio sp. HDW18 TaxID=2714948 RepID=UPI00140A2E57|nr:DUF5666 domain-containing protein [Vibrio sp. HDW18]QIL84601.1 hypothetical protein G7083_00910 [Vibrio sp. HDW18]